MKLLHALLVLVFVHSTQAQDAPAPPPAPPTETVQPAIPTAPLPSNAPPSFTQDDVRKIETALKKQMMLVGMGCGVIGILIGMMIGRKTAPRTTVRRF